MARQLHRRKVVSGSLERFVSVAPLGTLCADERVEAVGTNKQGCCWRVQLVLPANGDDSSLALYATSTPPSARKIP